MSNLDTAKLVAFTAIIALVGLIAIVINQHTLFSELVFQGLVITLVGVIVILVAYAFLWQRGTRYISSKKYRRRMDRLARNYYYDFKDFVDRFSKVSQDEPSPLRINAILGMLYGHAHGRIRERLIETRTSEFKYIIKKPLDDLKKRVDDLYWKNKEINYEFLSSLVKEFENLVSLHKQLYVDFTVIKAREIGLDKIPEATRRAYSEYKDDYNQFINVYTEFAKRCSKIRFRIFNEKLPKANEL